MSAPDPRAVYRERFAAAEAEFGRLTQRHYTFGNLRGLCIVAAVVAWYGGMGSAWWSLWWMAPPLAAFAVLAFVHERLLERRRAAELRMAWNRRGEGTLDGQWIGAGDDGARYAEPDHPFAADLDSFGRGSLFELLAKVRTRGGADVLARRLLTPANGDAMLSRQAAVRELAPKYELREDVALCAAEIPASVDFSAVVAWGEAPREIHARWLPYLTLPISTLTTAAILGLLTGWWATPALIGCIVLGVVYTTQAAAVKRVTANVDRRSAELRLSVQLLKLMEAEHASAADLRRLKDSVTPVGGAPASSCIAELQRIVDLLEQRRNMLFAPLAAVYLWPLLFALRLEGWRERYGARIGGWLTALAEFEAYNAVAHFAFDNPAFVYPEILPPPASPARVEIAAVALAHPLLAGAVANDLELGAPEQLLLVSGSNMSGKSTLLRTLGVNVVLAWIGAPACAREFKLTPCQLGATLRIQDSLHDGRSRFMAEVVRLRALLDLARQELPLVFLLDEVFHGTNSHDRQVGARAVLGKLLDAGAAGLATTHDLALTSLVERLQPRARNVHLVDRFENGGLVFDYRLRPGVVPKSNALALMRAVGIAVEDDGEASTQSTVG